MSLLVSFWLLFGCFLVYNIIFYDCIFYGDDIMFNDKGDFECHGRLKLKDKDKLIEKSVGIVVEIWSDSYLVYVIYTTNLILYLYGLFLVSNFICDLLFLS